MTIFRNVKTGRWKIDLGTALGYCVLLARHFEEAGPPPLDVQSEKASDYNNDDHYADDVEDVHLVCSGWLFASVGILLSRNGQVL